MIVAGWIIALGILYWLGRDFYRLYRWHKRNHR